MMDLLMLAVLAVCTGLVVALIRWSAKQVEDEE